MILESPALLLVEASDIPLSGPSIVRTEAYMRVAGIFLENKSVWAHGGLGHGIPPCDTEWNINDSD